MPVDRQMQSGLCLTASHDRCERYRQYVTRTGVSRPGRAAVADGLVSTRLVLTPEPTWRGIAGRARGARSGTIAVIGAGALALGAVGVTASAVVTGGGLDLAALLGPAASAEPGASAVPTPSERPTPSATATPSPVPATAVPTPTPSPVSTPVPTTAPTVTPVPTPTPQLTYTVVAGDSLALIAARFGTTVQELQAVNDIEDPNEIGVGQVLVIP